MIGRLIFAVVCFVCLHLCAAIFVFYHNLPLQYVIGGSLYIDSISLLLRFGRCQVSYSLTITQSYSDSVRSLCNSLSVLQ